MTYYNASCAHALLGDEEKALDYLEGAISRGWHHKEWLDHDTDFAFMRANPRFKKISAELDELFQTRAEDRS